MKIQTSHILLTNLKFYAYHGVDPQETKVGNTYIINLRINTNYLKAAKTDNVNDTISYADIFQSIKKEMEIPSKLLEHVIYRISARLFKDYPSIDDLDITLNKINPPMGADIETAGVHLYCTR